MQCTQFPCRIRSNDEAVIDIEFDLHMLRRSASPYCFALYLRHTSPQSEQEPSASNSALDAAALAIDPGMYLLGQHLQQQQQQQQQQLAAASGAGAQFVLGALQQPENLFMLGDMQQQHSSMFLLPPGS